MDIFHIADLPEDLQNETISRLPLKDLIKYCNISHDTKEYCFKNSNFLLRNYRIFTKKFEEINKDNIDYSVALNGLFWLYNNFMKKIYDEFKNGNITTVKIRFGPTNNYSIVLEITSPKQPILVLSTNSSVINFVQKLDKQMRLRNKQIVFIVLDYIFNILIETNHFIKFEGNEKLKTIFSL